MIAGDGLKAWLDDRDRTRRTHARASAFAQRWNAGEPNRRFARAMAALPDANAETVASAVAALFEDEDWVCELIDRLADELRRDPFFEPPFRQIGSDIHQGLIVSEDDNVSIAIGVTSTARLAAKKTAPRGRTSITFSGQVDVLRFLKAGGGRIAFWEAPPIEAGFSAAGAGRCERVGARPIEEGETLVIDGRHRSFVIDHARSNLVMLQASVKHGRAPLAVEYDSETCEYIGSSAADDSASRVQMITTLLRKLDCAAAFPAIAAFLDHPNFFVRWHVMRELLGLDAGAALPHLRRMAARDPHPEARRAARQALDRIERGAPRRKAA